MKTTTEERTTFMVSKNSGLGDGPIPSYSLMFSSLRWHESCFVCDLTRWTLQLVLVSVGGTHGKLPGYTVLLRALTM